MDVDVKSFPLEWGISGKKRKCYYIRPFSYTVDREWESFPLGLKRPQIGRDAEM
jgi:hypothetical protein